MPAGSSVRCLVHYAQGVNSGKFRKYDHGRAKNLEVYGTPDPPEYNVDRITAPVAFYWGENDWLGAKPVSYFRQMLLWHCIHISNNQLS